MLRGEPVARVIEAEQTEKGKTERNDRLIPVAAEFDDVSLLQTHPNTQNGAFGVSQTECAVLPKVMRLVAGAMHGEERPTLCSKVHRDRCGMCHRSKGIPSTVERLVRKDFC